MSQVDSAPSSSPSGLARRAKSQGREKRRDLDGVLEEGLRPGVARQKPRKRCVDVVSGGSL